MMCAQKLVQTTTSHFRILLVTGSFSSSKFSSQGLALVSGNTPQFPVVSLTSASRGIQTDSTCNNWQKEAEVQEQQNPDNPVTDIEDPFKEPHEPCILCKNKVPLSYKNVQLLSQFISPNTGRMYSRHITKLCGYQQKQVTKAINRARQMGFMPFMYRETIFLKDPNLFDIRYSGNVEIAMKEPSDLVEPENQPALEISAENEHERCDGGEEKEPTP